MPPASAAEPAAALSGPVEGDAGRVLIVDDDRELLAGCRETVEALGYAVATAGDGLSAIALLRSGAFDVVVSDIALPGADGLRVLRAARDHDPDLAVVLMTGSPEVETAVAAIEHGARRYLRKPFGLGDLQQVVRKAVRERRRTRREREALQAMGAAGEARVVLAASFERALARLWMAYQPIVRGASHEPFGFEALVRSDEPTVPDPGRLFAAAESLDRLPELGRAIRARVAAAVAADDSGRHYFVNLHPRELTDDLLLDPGTPFSALAPRIVLEITERASLDEVEGLDQRLAGLRRLGFRLCIDDLGAGYAGLTSFARLEPEVVKVDMSLVRGCHERPVNRKLIGSIGALCRDFGAVAVAEGVETEQERDAVVALGCELLQGWFIGRPARRPTS